jgi:hypothetical protein
LNFFQFFSCLYMKPVYKIGRREKREKGERRGEEGRGERG